MTSLSQQMKKGMGYGELIVDNIIGLDNEYESFGEKLGKAINDDEIGFLKDAAVGVYEGTKEFVTSPIETTKEVITDIKDTVKRLGSEDLDTRLKNMYDVSYDQATDQQVNSAKEAVLGDAMTALGLIPAAKAVTMVAKAGSTAIPNKVKVDVVDAEVVKGIEDNRSLSNIPLTKSKKETNPLVRNVNASNVEVQADLADFRSSVLGSLDNLAIGKDGMSGFQIKKFLEKRAPKINKTELYWSGLLENLDDNKKYSKQELKTLADINVPKVDIQVLDGSDVKYRGQQRVALNINNNVMEPLDGYKEILIVNKNTKGNEYSAGHYNAMFESNSNVLAHVRGSFVDNSDPDFPIKEKFFLVEELQSDAVQQHTVANKVIAKKINEEKTSKPTLGDIGLHYQTEFNSAIFDYHMNGLEFTDKFVKDIDSYNYNFRSIGDQDTAEQAIHLGLTKIIDDITKLKNDFVEGNRNKDEIAFLLSRFYGLKENSIKRRSIEELDEVDNIFANVLGDYVFGKTAVRKFNKENNNKLKKDLINTFEDINNTSSIEKDLVPAKLSDTIRMSLLAVIKESKSEGVNKIYIPSPEVMSKAHNLEIKAANNTYSDGVRKVLRTLNNETNGRIKFKNKNPEGVSYYENKNSIGIEIDITDFDLPDNPQFRFDKGGLAINQTEEILGVPTMRDPAVIDPTTGQPYDALGSMRQQAEQTRQAEAKEEFEKLKLPENIQEEAEKILRPKLRPEGLPSTYETRTAVDKVLELGYLLKEKQKTKGGLSRIVSGLDENNPVHQKTIKGFFDNAVGGDTGFDPTKDAWCAAFVNHVLTELGADLINSKDRYDRIRANKYKNYGKPVDINNIQEGDIVVFDFDKDGTADHVTFYAGGRITSQGEGQYINVIGGNQSGEVSIRENHPMYTLDTVAAIRRITYDGDAYEIAQSHKDSDPIFKTFLPEEHEDYAFNLQGNYNKGGMTMNGQMEMAFMQNGGLKDDGMKKDPISGNPIPNGSMAKEVRDDIPAQLSEGEYVVPADVVRYLGVKHFEDLRNKAKSGLQNMEANGRIGGEPIPPMQPQMADGGDLTPQEMNEITNMMNQGGMARKGYYGGGFSNTGSGTSFYNPDPAKTAEAISTPTRYTGSFSNVNRPIGTGAVVQDSPVTLYGPNGQVVTVQIPSQQEAYNNYLTQGYSTTPPGTTSITQPQTRSSSDSDDAKAEKKRLADMVSEQERASRVAIGDMTKEQALEAYQGAEMAKYLSSGMVALNPAIAIIGRLFAGNESKKIQARLKELGVTELPKVDYKKGGIIGNILGGTSLLDIVDGAITGLQEGKIGAGRSTYVAQFKPSNSGQYGNNLQQSTGSIWGSEQEAYDAAVKSGNYQVANHFDAVNRLRGKQNAFYDAAKGKSSAEQLALGQSMGLSAHDMNQAMKYGGSLGRAISQGVVEKEGFFGKYEFKEGKTVSDVQGGTTPAIVPTAGGGNQNIQPRNDDNEPSLAEQMQKKSQAAANNQTSGTSNTYVGRTDSSGKKLGETGYKSALKERQETKQAKAKVFKEAIESRDTTYDDVYNKGGLASRPKKKKK
tara:strand:- start:1642 stop:6318 length:4677 start_codon:yes stop_codon:yes gene_type:complete